MKNILPCVLILLLVAWLPSAHAQNTTFTYQGNLHDNGTNFTGLGQFQFALVTSSNANLTATATAASPVSGFITTINVTFGGTGYITAPVVSIFGGGGSGAAATAAVSNGVVTAIVINPGGNGSGYTNTPTVTVAAPPANITYTTLWSNDGTSSGGSEPSVGAAVGITNGLFNVVLGDTTIPNMSAIDADIFTQPGIQLLIWFNDGVNGFASLTPAQNLTPVPYAAFAAIASNLVGTVSADQISGTLATNALPASPEFSGTVSATDFSGNATNLTSLNAASLSVGTVPLARLSGITSNQLDPATWQTATNLNGGFAALATNVVSGINLTNAWITNSTVAGNGGGLTKLNASQLVSVGNTNGSAGNFFLGVAGNSTMTGDNNTGIGVNSLASNTNGTDNTASGLGALYQNTAGTRNTANGVYALYNNINGTNNTAAGVGALYSNVGGNYNLAAGANALYFTTSGNQNTAVGMEALYSNTTGGNNTAVGYNALYLSTVGSNNIALGYGAGQAIYGGSSNIDIGNPGFSGDANVIRIGSTQSATYLPGNLNVVSNIYANGVALSSDRNIKQGFTAIDASTVLTKLLELPITEWQYKTDAQGIRHLGPMAQDFHAAFSLNGSDDKHISVVDEGGVALAAIQGLNQKLEVTSHQLESENAALKRQNDVLIERLTRMEQTLETLQAVDQTLRKN